MVVYELLLVDVVLVVLTIVKLLVGVVQEVGIYGVVVNVTGAVIGSVCVLVAVAG